LLCAAIFFSVLEAGVVPDWPSIGVFAFFDCRFAKEICDSLVAKCLTGRPKTLEKTQAVFLLWVELEATDAFLVRALQLT
jgi:hypothetical protein